jgi:hypothetical protein
VAGEVVRVEGVRELDQALRLMDADLRRELRRELTNVGKIVSEDARSRLGAFSARSAAGIRPRLRSAAEITIEQRKGKTTGAHPEWGAFQMRKVLLPARESKRSEVLEALEDMLTRIGRRAGF